MERCNQLLVRDQVGDAPLQRDRGGHWGKTRNGHGRGVGMSCNLEKDARLALFVEVEASGTQVRVVRMVDRKRNTLVYLTYSDRVIEGSPQNSVTAVAVDRSTPIPVK